MRVHRRQLLCRCRTCFLLRRSRNNLTAIRRALEGSANFMSGDLAGAIAVQLGAIRKIQFAPRLTLSSDAPTFAPYKEGRKEWRRKAELLPKVRLLRNPRRASGLITNNPISHSLHFNRLKK